jgi:signal transduction histidine kinase
MSIVESAITAHGGSVDVDTLPGRGTTVRIRMPRR